jgi:hypothetical protein
MQREAVDHQGVAQQVEVLAGVAEAVGAPDPEAVALSEIARLGVEKMVDNPDGRTGGPEKLGPRCCMARVSSSHGHSLPQ